MDDIILGPCRCQACHAPSLFFTSKGWRQREWIGRAPRLTSKYVKHVCPLARPMFDFKP